MIYKIVKNYIYISKNKDFLRKRDRIHNVKQLNISKSHIKPLQMEIAKKKNTRRLSMNKLKKIIRILIIFILLMSCDAADQYLGINETLLDEEDDGGGVSNFYESISEAMADGVIGYWKFDTIEAGGFIRDLTGYMNGTSMGTGGPTINSNGKFGNCLYFDGNDYIQITSNPLTTSQSYTYSFWINRLINTTGMIFDTTTGRLYIQITAASGNLRFYDGANKDYGYLIPTTTWTHVVLVANASTLQTYLYINGDSQGLTLVYAPKNFTGTKRIGYSTANTAYLTSYLDDFAIWNRALSESEIKVIESKSSYPLVP